jgi:acyl carrier protein
MIPYREELQGVFREVLGDERLVLRPEMTGADLSGWDSGRHVILMAAIEARFGIRFATAEIMKLMSAGSNVGTILAILLAKLGEPASEAPWRAAAG